MNLSTFAMNLSPSKKVLLSFCKESIGFSMKSCSFSLEYGFVKWSPSKSSLSYVAFIGNLIQLLQGILFRFCKESFNFCMKSFSFCYKFSLTFGRNLLAPLWNHV